MSRKITQVGFLNEAKKVHGGRYNYIKAVVVDSKTRVVIICKDHGEFEQTPQKHLTGRGCRKCYFSSSRLGFSEFVKRARGVHGNYFDYTEVFYTRNDVKVKIGCPEHGPFLVRPFQHLEGSTCPKCAAVIRTDCLRSTRKEFISRAKKVHGRSYTYPNTIYKNSQTKVEIFCRKHGKFFQTPAAHLSGSGCPRCSESGGEKAIRKFLRMKRVHFLTQHAFSSCKNVKKLPFDFFLVGKRALVEFDGKQHFKSVPFFGGVTVLKGIQKRDAIKTKWAEENRYSLLRISYRENIGEKLNSFLVGLTTNKN